MFFFRKGPLQRYLKIKTNACVCGHIFDERQRMIASLEIPVRKLHLSYVTVKF